MVGFTETFCPGFVIYFQQFVFSIGRKRALKQTRERLFKSHLARNQHFAFSKGVAFAG